MKTLFCETKQKQPFDWNLFLENAINNKITSIQYGKAFSLADQWVTCAVGNQCSIIPRLGCGTPKDFVLHSLGLKFNNLIRQRFFVEAKKTLKQIEKRSIELINEIENKTK